MINPWLIFFCSSSSVFSHKHGWQMTNKYQAATSIFLLLWVNAGTAMFNKQRFFFFPSDQRQPRQDAYWGTLLLIWVVEKYLAFAGLSASTELSLKTGTVRLFVEALLLLLEVLPWSETSNLPSWMCFLNIITQKTNIKNPTTTMTGPSQRKRSI